MNLVEHSNCCKPLAQVQRVKYELSTIHHLREYTQVGCCSAEHTQHRSCTPVLYHYHQKEYLHQSPLRVGWVIGQSQSPQVSIGQDDACHTAFVSIAWWSRLEFHLLSYQNGIVYNRRTTFRTPLRGRSQITLFRFNVIMTPREGGRGRDVNMRKPREQV